MSKFTDKTFTKQNQTKHNMQIVPTQNHMVIAMRDLHKSDAGLVLPEQSQQHLVPYGKVLAVGPDCKTIKVGDSVLFHPANLIAGFDQGESTERFVIPESCVYATILLENE